tara:strand:- start:20024 stop:20935 length:912 start_codon:yes stop_codon:yes gene_type:complete
MKKNSIVLLSTAFIIAGLASCSSQYYKKPESIESKMARYNASDINKNKVPKYTLPDFDGKKLSTRSRMPASANHQNESEKVDIPTSNKKLYFLGLVDQYNKLKSYVPSNYSPEVNICPSFHTTLLNHKATTSSHSGEKKIDFKTKYTSLGEKEVKQYPELSLPVTVESTSPRVVDILRTNNEVSSKKTHEIVTNALKVHLKKTYDEIYELCETGTSENYYIFENMITSVNRNQKLFSPSSENLQKYFKVTVFSNIALMKSLEKSVHTTSSRAPASAIRPVNYSKAITSRMKANWAYDYIQSYY